MACNDINQVEVAVSSKLQRQIDEYRVDMEFFTLKEAETIVNFISADPDDRRIRNKYVWENTCLRNSAYFVLFQLLEKMCQSTPFSIVDRHLSGFSSLIRTVKERSFEGASLDELVGFVHENEKNTKDSVKELKCFEKDCKDTTDIAATRLKFCDAELQDMKAQIKEAKKARKASYVTSLSCPLKLQTVDMGKGAVNLVLQVVGFHPRSTFLLLNECSIWCESDQEDSLYTNMKLHIHHVLLASLHFGC